MNKPIYVLGAGGHAKVIIDALRSQGLTPSGVVDPVAPNDHKVLGVNVIGDDEVLKKFAPDSIWLANGVGATPHSRVNTKLFEIWRDKGYSFIKVQHASAVVSAHAVVHEGSQIMAGAVVQAASVIEAGVVINTGARVDHDCVIGQHCFIAPSVTICGGVKVQERTFIGAGAVLLPGVRIGANALIAANALVFDDVADGGSVLRG